jgi:hypothetical protein
MKLISGREDMRWLRDVHLPRVSLRRYKSAVLHGSEDCPSRVELYRSSNPSRNAQKIVYVNRGSGCRLKRKR